MKSSDNLFHLIKSLTKAEKRYFTLSALKNSADKNYTKLFSEIDRQTKGSIYNEQLIKERFKDEKFIKQLTFTKNYLYNLILKSLISFHSGNNIEARIYNLILSAKIFFKKSLYTDYFRNLETAKLLAEKTEKFGILLDIIKLQMRLVRLKDRKKYRHRNLYDEEMKTIKKIENITEYSKLLNSYYKITKISDHARSKILYKETLSILDNPLLSKSKNALSVTALDKYYLLTIYKNEFIENYDMLFDTSLKRFELYKKNPAVFKSDLENKEMLLLYWLLYYSVVSGNFTYYKKHINDFVNLLDTNLISACEVPDVIINGDYLQSLYCYKKGNLKDAVKFAETIFVKIRSNESGQNKDDLLSFYFFYAKILFEFKSYLKALDVVKIIISHRYKDVRYDILSYSYFLEIFIHYELGNYQLAGSYILALSRKLSRHKEKELSEKIILKFFKEISSVTKISEEFVLKKYLEKFQKLRKNKFEKVFFNELPIDKWIAKKIS